MGNGDTAHPFVLDPRAFLARHLEDGQATILGSAEQEAVGWPRAWRCRGCVVDVRGMHSFHTSSAREWHEPCVCTCECACVCGCAVDGSWTFKACIRFHTSNAREWRGAMNKQMRVTKDVRSTQPIVRCQGMTIGRPCASRKYTKIRRKKPREEKNSSARVVVRQPQP
jgi:hypothetical protein